jgi:hypothetical protein
VLWGVALFGFALSGVFLTRHMPWVGLVLGAHTLLFVVALRHGTKPSLSATGTRARKLVFLPGLMAAVAAARPEVLAASLT